MNDLLRDALDAYKNAPNEPTSDRLARAKGLGDYGKLSKRQIAAIVGLRPMAVQDIIQKSSRTGGLLVPDALPLLAEATELEGEVFWEKVYRAYINGASVNAIAVLLDIRASTIWYWVRRIRDGEES